MKRLLMTASAIATLAAPALALAQDLHDQRPQQRQERQDQRQDRQDQRQDRQDQRQDRRDDQRDDRGRVIVRPVPGHPAAGTIMRVDPSRPGAARPLWTRGDRNWWRGRPEFRGYAGIRPGFWFRPGFGYVRVDPRWYGYGWRVGGYVPAQFRGYYVPSAALYGLAPAPYGYAYVYLGNNIALMSRANGLIVQVYPNIY